MILKIYTVFDSATGAYMRPFFMQSDGQAMRSFIDEVNGDSPMAKHPEDYALFALGDFDDNTGTFDCVEPRCLARAHELLTKVEG